MNFLVNFASLSLPQTYLFMVCFVTILVTLLYVLSIKYTSSQRYIGITNLAGSVLIIVGALYYTLLANMLDVPILDVVVDNVLQQDLYVFILLQILVLLHYPIFRKKRNDEKLRVLIATSTVVITLLSVPFLINALGDI